MAKKSINSIWGAIKQAGFTKLGYMAAAIGCWILGFPALVTGAFIGIAIYVNANTIWKYMLEGLNKEI